MKFSTATPGTNQDSDRGRSMIGKSGPGDLMMATIHEYEALSNLINSDPEYAWCVHCNIAMPIMDELGCTPQQANEAAARLMQHLWGCDITRHEHYAYKGEEPAS